MTKQLLLLLTLTGVLFSCSTTQTATQTEPAEYSEKDREPVDFSTMLEPPKDWHHLDEVKSKFRGISSRRAYNTLLEGMSPEKEIVVAVIDGGVDPEHEDLREVMWVNEEEVPDNGEDDDGNGYVDDVHGWNFIGGADGENINHDTFELTRIYRELQPQFENTGGSSLSGEAQEEQAYYQEIKSAYENRVRELNEQYNNILNIQQAMDQAGEILEEHFDSTSYSYEQVQQLQPTEPELNFAKNVMTYVMENDIDSSMIADQKKQIYEFAKYGYNPDYNPRHIVGDNYEDKKERHYGNNDVAGPDPSHGSHVAGIIGADRDNEIGINGVADNVRIMAIRAVPNGDERDKDVANAIRYAVDNGADIINMSFGKGYSPHREVVNEAIRHADEQGVLMVHGAGNDAENSDERPSYPTDTYGSILSDSSATLWLSVGATSWKPNEEFVANFSNYGDRTVDLFAPGVDIYSTMPDNEYEFQQGTSMAAPVVSGTAALVMSYYPDLSAGQVRQLIMENTVQYPSQKVRKPHAGDPQEAESVVFRQLSVSDGVVNVYRALEAAERLSNGE